MVDAISTGVVMGSESRNREIDRHLQLHALISANVCMMPGTAIWLELHRANMLHSDKILQNLSS
jgi:hypothetical protein